MIERLYPLSARLLERLRGPRPPEALARSRRILHPAEVSALPGVEMDPEDRDRVIAAQADTDLPAEWARIAGRPQAQHGATVLYDLRNVLATPRGLFTWRGAPCAHGTPPLAETLRSPILKRPAGFFPLPPFGIPYFAHWLLDGLPTVAMRGSDEDLFLPVPPGWEHARGYVDLLGLAPLRAPYVHFERLTLALDLGKNASLRERMRALRADLLSRISGPGGQRVYIRRTRGAPRRLLNEGELLPRLEERGFLILSDSDPLDQILRAADRAEMVVGVEGSHLAHFLLPGTDHTRLITLNPADRFNNLYADYAGALGGRQATLVITPEAEGYRLDVARLLRLIDRMAR
jgi:capsular polysaccharide biosynthesis protein